METVGESVKNLIELGKEFAFEGLGPEDFQAQNEDELKAFSIGYQEGQNILREKETLKTNVPSQVEETPRMKM